jgi:NAD(P)-dependent dehydrogenase (short-subunit alcohol dehydrogenase family)
VALQLAASGWTVFAGVRDAGVGEELAAEAAGDLRSLLLDITDAAHIDALEGALPDRLDAVVNNAGVVVNGPVETLTIDELRRQFEINVFGQIAVTNAVLPKIRAATGRIVFVSSLSGRISTPMTGAYNGSKFALEALADALRLELRPWGIKVILVEPAQTDTDIWRGASDAFDEAAAAIPEPLRALYQGHLDGFRRTIPLSRKLAGPAEQVAASIEHAATTKRPRARYVVGASPKVQAGFMHLAPAAVTDRILGRITGVPRSIKR